MNVKDASFAYQAVYRYLVRLIETAPGEVFSQQGAWKHHLRLSYTLDWSKDIPQALTRLSAKSTSQT